MPMTPTLPQRGLLLGLACLLSACQTFIDGDQQLYEQSGKLLDESLQQAQTSAKVTPPPAVQAALLPPLSSSVFAGGPRFDVAAKDMPARDFFLSLMDSAGQNLVVHPAVSGNITFSLRRVTLEEVLAAVRDSYGYDFRRTSYGYQILPNEKVTRSYDLNYLNLQRLGESDTRVSSGQVESSETDTSSDSSGSTSSDRSVTTLNASKVITTSNVDFWREVQAVVQAIVGGEEGNSVVVNPQASLLVVRASSPDQENVARFLEQAQRNLQRQVVLETKILEVQLKDGFQAGISWSQIGSEVGGVLDGENLTGPDGIGGVFSGILNLGDFTGLIQLLQTQGEVRVLSSPRISTLNNQKAVIKVGTDEFFVTEVSSSSTTTTAAGVTEPTQDITLTPFFSGISLDVTPQIDDDGNIILHVHPSVSVVEEKTKNVNLGDLGTFTLPLASSTINETDSIVRVQDGSIVAIGGLMSQEQNTSRYGLPGVSGVPGLGLLFGQKSVSNRKRELVILMRSTIIKGEESWRTVAGETQQRLQGMDPRQQRHIEWQ